MSLQQLQALLQQGQAGQLGGGPAVSFKAGKCKFENQTVTAEPQKGEVVITKSDDGIHRFVWRTRAANPQDVDDVMLIGQISWEKVPECKDGRVFALRVGGSVGRGGRLRFYWMQEPKDDKDEQHFKKINELLTASGTGGGAGGLGAFGGGAAGAGGLGGALGGISVDNQAALLSMFQQEAAAQRAQQQGGASSSSANAPSSSADASSSSDNSNNPSGSQAAAQPVVNQQLQQAFASAFSNMAAAQQARLANQTPEEKFLHQGDHSLADTLDADAIIRLLGSDEAAMKQLLPHLPEEEQTEAGLRANLRSPQLRQTLDRIQGVLNSGEMAGLLQQLGLPVVNEIGVKALIDSVQKSVEDEKKKNGDGGDGDAAQ